MAIESGNRIYRIVDFDCVADVGTVSYTHLDVYKRQGFNTTGMEIIYKVVQTPLQKMTDSLGGAVLMCFTGDVYKRQAYDICVSRAVANLSTLSEYCLPFVKMGGCFVSYLSLIHI